MGKILPSISTGMPSLDYEVFGCGGVPRGRVIEIFGPESAGKTTMALHFVGREQAAKGVVAFVDAEHSLSPTYAHHLGVDVDNLIVNQPNSGEQALTVVEELVESQCVTLIVVDSVAALVPEAELAGEMGDSLPGLQARLMSQALRKLTGKCAVNNVTLVFINQIREKIGVMFGNPETTTGGRALKFYSSVRLDVRRRSEIKDGEALVGHQLEVKAVKNKVATPFKSSKIDLYYPGTMHQPGLDLFGDMITYAIKLGLFEVAGSWYSIDLGNKDDKGKLVGVERLANGIANLKDRLRSDAKATKLLVSKIDEAIKAGLEIKP